MVTSACRPCQTCWLLTSVVFFFFSSSHNKQEEPTASAKVQFNVSKIYRWRFGMHSAPNMGNKPHEQKKIGRKKNKSPNTDRDLKTTKKPSEKKAQTKPNTKIVQNMLSCWGNKPGTRQNNLVLKNGIGNGNGWHAQKKWARLKVTSRYLIFVLMEGNKVS